MRLRMITAASLALLLVATIAAGAAGGSGKIRLHVAELDVASLGLPTPAALARADAGMLWIVHFDHSPGSEERQAIADAGGEVLGYLPEHAYLIRGEAAALAKLARLRGVDALNEFQPAWKVSPFLESGDRGWLNLSLSFAPGTDIARAARAAQTLGVELISTSDRSPRPRLSLRALPEQVEALSHLPGLIWLDRTQIPTPRNDDIKWAVQSGIPDSIPIWDHGIHGEGQIIGHIDSAFDTEFQLYCWFQDPEGDPIGPDHRKVAFLGDHNPSGAGAGHGTHTAGTLVADPEPINGQTTRRGLAYMARMAHSPYFRPPGQTYDDLYLDLVLHQNVGARVHSNSWGDDTATHYTEWCRQIDLFSWEYEENMVAFAVTNLTNLKTPENATCVVAVGSTKAGYEYGEYNGGGKGPTSDGRRKPEIFSPGRSINSAVNGQLCHLFTNMSGTSMACPGIAAGAALARQYFVDGWYPNGVPSARSSLIPSGALLRAVLLNATLWLENLYSEDYPNDQIGWGRLALDESLHFAGEERQLWVEDVRNAQGLATAEQRSYNFQIHDSSQTLKVALAFTDYPGEVSVPLSVVNDIDLVVTGPTGEYLGNVFDGPTRESMTGGTADSLNSVERVLIISPEVGDWSVTVIGSEVVMGTQGYGLSVSASFASTPAANSFFTAEAVEGGVDLMWEIADGSSAADLRLIVEHEGDSREVEFTATAPDTSVARDRHPELRRGGIFDYSLQSRQGDLEWRALRSNAIELESAPYATALLGAFPNPFNPFTTARFYLAEEQRAKLEIFDTSGRRVALLVDETLPEGEHGRDWWGRDDEGRELASGVYFLRFEAPGHAENTKLVLIR
jgi:hypothetical protein